MEVTRQFVIKRKKIINKGDAKNVSDATSTDDVIGNILRELAGLVFF